VRHVGNGAGSRSRRRCIHGSTPRVATTHANVVVGKIVIAKRGVFVVILAARRASLGGNGVHT
jgi:hypothetical protein